MTNPDSGVDPQSSSADQTDHDEACVYALEQLMKGHKPAQIRKSLLDAGYPAKQCDKIMRIAIDFRRENDTKIGPGGVVEGSNNQLFGFIFILAGFVITIGSFMMAGPGGTYVVTTGLIITGFVMLFRGLGQSNRQ